MRRVCRHASQLRKPWCTPCTKSSVTRASPYSTTITNRDTKHGVEIDVLLASSAASNETRQERAELHRRLTDVVQKHFGDTFGVADLSMHRWAYNVEGTIREFAIVDNQYPQGIPPEVDHSVLPDVYDTVKVASVLSDSGFKDTSPKKLEQPHEGPQFPDHVISSGELPFVLSTPGPTLEPLMRLLRGYMAITDRLRELVTFLHLWTRSHNIHDVLPPRLLALIAIHLFQRHTAFVTPLQTPPLPFVTGGSLQEDHVWIYGPPGTSYQVNVGFNRAIHYERPLKRLVESFFFQCTETNLTCRQLTIRNITPPSRKGSDRMSLPDPFIYTHDYADAIPPERFKQFLELLQDARTLLKPGNEASLFDIFGPHIPELMPSTSQLNAAEEHYSDVHKYVMTRYKNTRPTSDTILKRNKIIEKVRRLISKNVKKGPSYKIRPFGSTVIGLDTANSDVDLVVIDPARQPGSPTIKPFKDFNRQSAIYRVKSLGKTLSRAGFVGVEARPTASVPIVKFKDKETGLSCDLSIGEQLGLINTQLIKQYCDLLPILPAVVLALKSWAKPLGLNSPSNNKAGTGGASFSSYALCLMTIGLFQHKGWLPNLQDVPEEECKYYWFKAKKTAVLCRVGFHTASDWKRRDVRADEALLTWFKFWGEEFDYQNDMVNVRHGGIVARTHRSYYVPSEDGEDGEDDEDDEDDEDLKLLRDMAEDPEVDSEQGWGLKLALKSEIEASDPDGSSVEQEESDGQMDTTKDEVNEFDLPAPPKLEDDGDEIDRPAPQQPEGGKKPQIVYRDRAPSSWKTDAFVVADPFITTKNTASMVSYGKISEFRAECMHAHSMLLEGKTWMDIIGYANSKVKKGTGKGTGKGKGKRKGKRK